MESYICCVLDRRGPKFDDEKDMDTAFLWQCQADDPDHALEQAQNAHPDNVVEWVCTESDYNAWPDMLKRDDTVHGRSVAGGTVHTIRDRRVGA